MKKLVMVGVMTVFGARAALAATNPAMASAASACCTSLCCTLGLPCC